MMKLKVLIVFVFLVNLVNGARIYKDGRIIGGEDAREGEFPYQVQLLEGGWFICGGTIVSKDFVLTAAHCVQYKTLPFLYKIIAGTRELGTDKGQSRTAKKINVHEEWDLATVHNDLALLRLNQPLELNDNVKPISLPTEDTAEGSDLVLSGWGQTSNPGNSAQILQKLNAKVTNLKQCNNTIIEIDKLYLEETQICAFSQKQEGACYGDSGSPLALRNKYIVGIASMVIGDCALGRPDVFTRVYKYVDWIQEHINKAEM